MKNTISPTTLNRCHPSTHKLLSLIVRDATYFELYNQWTFGWDLNKMCQSIGQTKKQVLLQYILLCRYGFIVNLSQNELIDDEFLCCIVHIPLIIK